MMDRRSLEETPLFRLRRYSSMVDVLPGSSSQASASRSNSPRLEAKCLENVPSVPTFPDSVCHSARREQRA